MKNIRYILVILISLVGVGCFAQPSNNITWFRAQDTAELKAYKGTADAVRVIGQPDSIFLLCYTCTVDDITVLQGYAYRKWRLLQTSGGGLNADDSLDYRTTTQLTDTSYKLNRPNGTETIFRYGVNASSSGDTIGIKIPRYVDSVTKASDSFRVWKGGVYTALKDSVNAAGVSTRDRFGFPSEDVTAGENRTFDLGSTYSLQINSAQTSGANYAFRVTNSSSGSAIHGQASGAGTGVQGSSSSQSGVYGVSSSGTGVYGLSTSGNAIFGQSTSGTAATFSHNPASTNISTMVAQFTRATSGTAANGLGGHVQFNGETTDFLVYSMGTVGFRWTDVTTATRSSKFELATTQNTTTAVRLIVTDIPTHADEAAATAAGLETGTMYKTSTGVLMIKL